MKKAPLKVCEKIYEGQKAGIVSLTIPAFYEIILLVYFNLRTVDKIEIHTYGRPAFRFGDEVEFNKRKSKRKKE